MLLEDYSKPAIQSHKGFKSWSSSANFRISLSRLMAWRRRSFASSMGLEERFGDVQFPTVAFYRGGMRQNRDHRQLVISG